MSKTEGSLKLDKIAECFSNLNCNDQIEIDHSFFDGPGDVMRDVPQSKTSKENERQNNCTKRSVKRVKIKLSKDMLKKSNDVEDLMNCIAYQTKVDVSEEDRIKSPDSSSSDTTSDITDVTPRPSSSGCSSLTTSEIYGDSRINSADKCVKEVHNESFNKKELKPLQFLQYALDSLESEVQYRSSNSSSVKKRNIPRRNMSFSNEQLRGIERENQILLRKIEENLKPRVKRPAPPMSCPRIASSAINRQRLQKRIEHDNLILLKKLEKVKGTLNTRAGAKKL